MTQQQFLEEIKQLSIAERIALIEVISRTLREDLEMSGGEKERERRITAVERLRGILKTSENPLSDEDVRGSGEDKVPISQRLYGILKFDGEAPGDDELKDAYADYLQEKYS
jgi:hypothetical protein